MGGAHLVPGEDPETNRSKATNGDPPAASKSLPLRKKQSRSRSRHLESDNDPADHAARQFASGSSRNGTLTVNIPKTPDMADAAFAALQYLPTPLLVLSSAKTVVMANQAMESLLEQGTGEEGDNEPPTSQSNGLQGRSLSQLGIDLLEDGRPVWLSWSSYLDGIVAETEGENHDSAGVEHQENQQGHGRQGEASSSDKGQLHSAATVGATNREPSSARPRVRNAVVEVVLSAQQLRATSATPSRGSRSPATVQQIQAKMTITTWTMCKEQYFTLTFHGIFPSHTTTPQPTSPATQTSNQLLFSPTSASTPINGSNISSARTSPSGVAFSTSSLTPQGSQSPAEMPPSRSILERITRMKDAVLDIMELPVFAMWKDETLAYANKAGRGLAFQPVEQLFKSSSDLTSSYPVYTPDFERELDPSEYPIVQIVRKQTPFRGWKIGMKSPKTGKNLIYDVGGEPILDEKTGGAFFQPCICLIPSLILAYRVYCWNDLAEGYH